MASKFQDRFKQLDADRVIVKFGPEVTTAIRNLSRALEHAPGMEDTKGFLNDLSEYPRHTIPTAICAVSTIMRETSLYAEKSGNSVVKELLENFEDALRNENIVSPPITVEMHSKIPRR